MTLYDYCIENNCTELLDEWHSEKNGKLTPKDITSGSSRKVWWRCNKSHVWTGTVSQRTNRKIGCPYCASKKTLVGFNDLTTVCPQVASQWHPTKNGKLKPEDVLPGSHRKVWWRCEKGHEWEAQVRSRSRGDGCPVCANRLIIPGFNDLATTNPDLAAQWHPTKNDTTSPRTISYGTFKKVWWLCDKGHEWQASIDSRSHGRGCPVCAGKIVIPGENDLASAFPSIATEWHPTKNGDLRPDMVAPYANRKVWWLCDKGHEYHALISHRVKHNSGCPYCASKKVLVGFNDLATIYPKIAAQWHPTLNGDLTPEMVTCGSAKKVWWQCDDGHVWQTVVHIRTGPQKCGCPVCAGKISKKRLERYKAIQEEALEKQLKK